MQDCFPALHACCSCFTVPLFPSLSQYSTLNQKGQSLLNKAMCRLYTLIAL